MYRVTVIGASAVNRDINALLEYESALSNLKFKAAEEIGREMDVQADLLRKDTTAPYTMVLVATSLLMNTFFYFMLDRFMLCWIAASFYCVVLGPFVFLVPSGMGGGAPPLKNIKQNLGAYIKRIEGARVQEHKRALGHILWNTFFVNSEPLAIGLTVIFTFDIAFAIVTGFQSTILSTFDAAWVIYQSFAIIIFYWGIVILKPYKIEFFQSLININRRVRSAVKRTWQVIIILAALSFGIGTVVITAMLLPGFTLGQISTPNYFGTWSILPIAVITASQFILLRFLQGIHSRMMLLSWSRNKERILREHVLSPAANESEVDSEASRISDYERRYLNYLSVKIYTHDCQSLFGYLPVFFIVPDFSFLLDKEVIGTLKDNIGLHAPL